MALRPVMARVMYGMWGPATDPGSRVFTETLRREVPGIDLGRSPYRDYDVQEIVSDLTHSPKDTVRFVIGASLGANNCPVVGKRTTVLIHGIFGFQASSGGVDQPISENVLFAHEFYNSLWFMTWGLGNRKWRLESGNKRTGLVLTNEWAMHPGETPKATGAFLAEIKRIRRVPGD